MEYVLQLQLAWSSTSTCLQILLVCYIYFNVSTNYIHARVHYDASYHDDQASRR